MLDTILASTRLRLPALLDQADDFRSAAKTMPAAPSLLDALGAPGLAVVAEVKRRSPSRGDLAPDLDPVAQAAAYAEGGASAISVLTEPEFFSGSAADLVSVAAKLELPVLRKDFTLDPVQVWEARSLGAAAVLLIVAALDDSSLGQLLAETRAAGLDALVEVHTDDEARRAVAAGASIIGVNNRDLTDFSVDLATSERIRSLLPAEVVTVAESGILTAADAARMTAAGYDAVLVGEALVRAPDPAALVAEMRSGTA